MISDTDLKYQETIDFLYSRLPVFHRIGQAAYKADLNNTIAICDILGNPHKKLRNCIHIAGTNGKGSVSHILAAIFQLAGYKTGLYTSPHLKDFSERIRINGEAINKNYVINFVNQHYPSFEPINASFFEITVAMAFSYFAENNTDINIIETGLGGRLDSTNVISPILSVITNIDYDHTNLLGATLPQIAYEKAGIIKDNIPVVIGESNIKTDRVFKEKAYNTKSAIYFADKLLFPYNVVYQATDNINLQLDIQNQTGEMIIKDITLDLKGLYQVKNAITVIQSMNVLREKIFEINNNIVKNALENVVKLTGIRGRWEILSKKPLIICDTAHNTAGIKEVINLINKTNYQHLHFVIGMVNDKNIDGVLNMLPKNATYYFCKPNIPRGLDQNILQQQANPIGLQGNTYKSVLEALQAAKNNAKADDLIFIGGSTFVVAEIV